MLNRAVLTQSYLNPLYPSFRKAINTEIKLTNCQAYSYIPDMEGDPFSENSVWSFNYFFVDNDARKIVYFTCIATAGKRGHLGGRGCRGGGGGDGGGHGTSDTGGESDYLSVDDYSNGNSPRSLSPSMSPYSIGVYGSPVGNADEEEGEELDEEMDSNVGHGGYHGQGVAIQVDDDSDSSCDEMR